jgi:hypothetical protein
VIGQNVTLDGSKFRVMHVRCAEGLVHSVLTQTGVRMYAPQHSLDSAVFGADPTDDEVLTCFTCINTVFKSTPVRDKIPTRPTDMLEDGEETYDNDD